MPAGSGEVVGRSRFWDDHAGAGELGCQLSFEPGDSGIIAVNEDDVCRLEGFQVGKDCLTGGEIGRAHV